MRAISLRSFNNFLSSIIVLLAAYIIIWPVLPQATWWVKHEAPIISAAPALPAVNIVPKNNTLVIPSLGLSQEIHEGTSAATLNKGVWHMPHTSSPDQGSNTVLSGHRFTYSGKSVFYYLDKVAVGDHIHIYWQGKKYNYTVATIREVQPTEISIEDPTEDTRLTIYTCTPLWSAKNRLVLQANLVGVE